MSFSVLMVLVGCLETKEKSPEISEGYYENGVLRYRETFVDGKRNGETKTYYSSGLVDEIQFWQEDSLYGDQYKYFNIADTVISLDQDQNPMLYSVSRLKQYLFVNEQKRAILLLEMDSLGNLVNRQGHYLVSVIGEPDSLVLAFPRIVKEILVELYQTTDEGKLIQLENLSVSSEERSFKISDDVRSNLMLISKVDFNSKLDKDTTYINLP